MLRFHTDWTAHEKLDDWLASALSIDAALPFSFEIGGHSSREALPRWKRDLAQTENGKTELRFESPDGLRAILEIQIFEPFGAAEWLLSFENAGQADSPLIENVRAMDLCVECSPFRTAGTSQFGAHDNILHYFGGSDCKIDDFIPLKEVLHFICNRESMHFESVGGRPTSGSHGAAPYFAIQTQESGAILALGWSGQWQLDVRMRENECPGEAFESLAGMPVLGDGQKPCFRFEGGMPGISLHLKPGEKIRSPRALMMPWTGELTWAYNRFRAFMLAHHSPRAHGQWALPPIDVSSWGTREALNLAEIESAHASGLPFDTYWIDAGWYGPEGTHCDDPLQQDWAKYVGYWDHDPSRYPGGLKPISDRAHLRGMRFLLWMEPDRAVLGTPATVEHPDFFLGERREGNSLLFNLGDPEGQRWMLEKLSEKIEQYGIDILRIDYNSGNPLADWSANDHEGRLGMTQIRAVEGLYALWDALLQRFPGLMIDNCASGGRRLDFEALSRSVPLFRSDYLCYADNDPIGLQVQTGGLARFAPISATSLTGALGDFYRFRSTLSQGMNFSTQQVEEALGNPSKMAVLQKMLGELSRVRPLFYGDYYPFTGVTIERTDWYAYQLYRPDLGRGAVFSFRRDQCPLTEANYPLMGLEPGARYRLEDADSGESWEALGEALLREGLTVRIAQRRASSLIYIDKMEA